MMDCLSNTLHSDGMRSSSVPCATRIDAPVTAVQTASSIFYAWSEWAPCRSHRTQLKLTAQQHYESTCMISVLRAWYGNVCREKKAIRLWMNIHCSKVCQGHDSTARCLYRIVN